MWSSVPKHPKRSRFSLSEVLEEMDRSESDGENDQLSGLESADSMSEAAFEDGLDPLQDFEDTEENPPTEENPFDVPDSCGIWIEVFVMHTHHGYISGTPKLSKKATF